MISNKRACQNLKEWNVNDIVGFLKGYDDMSESKRVECKCITKAEHKPSTRSESKRVECKLAPKSVVPSGNTHQNLKKEREEAEIIC